MSGYNPAISHHLMQRYRPELQRAARAAVDKVVGMAVDERGADVPMLGGGDRRQLRGIPVVGRGVGGTSPGTDPYAALDRQERRSA